LNGGALYSALHTIQNKIIRNKYKYGDYKEEAQKLLEEIREEINNEIGDLLDHVS